MGKYSPRIQEGFMVEEVFIRALARGAGGKKLTLHIPTESADKLEAIAKQFCLSDWEVAEEFILPEEGGEALPQDIWDYALHVDFIVNWKGYLVAVDCTLRQDKVKCKYSNHRRCSKALQALGIDRAISLLVVQGDVPKRDFIADFEEIVRDVCKQPHFARSATQTI